MDWFDLLNVQFLWKDFNKAPSIVLGILASVFSQYLSYRLGVESLFSAYHKASFALCPFCLWGRNYLYILRICKSLPSFLRHLPVSRLSSSACPEIYFLKSINNTHFNFKHLHTSRGRLNTDWLQTQSRVIHSIIAASPGFQIYFLNYSWDWESIL